MSDPRRMLPVEVGKYDDVAPSVAAASRPNNLQYQDMLEVEERQLIHSLLDCSPPCHPRRGAMRHVTSTTTPLRDEHIPEMEVAVQRYTDPFLYFSSDKRRLEHLLGKELPAMPSVEPTERKKRISFEMDPFFLMISSFPELLLDGSSDDEDE